MPQFFVQDPNESIEYQMLWTSVLPDGVTILESTWTGSEGLVISDEALEGDFTAAFVSVETPNSVIHKQLTISNTVTLSNNEVYADSIFIFFEEK